MDTRFWGPSGWHLLHLIAAAPYRPGVQEWMELLEYVLPCKYCRASFHDYMKLQPLTHAIVKDRDAFSRWVYDIHNRVNAKLRRQGLYSKKDPSWQSVRKLYVKCPTPMVGWDFLTSIAYSTPSATPDLATRTRKERITKLCRWWKLIPSILPSPAWRQAWASASSVAGPIPLTKGREAVMNWMWRVEELVCADLKCPTLHPSLPDLKHGVAVFESDCGRVRRGKTCRTRKNHLRRQYLTRRRERVSEYRILDLGI